MLPGVSATATIRPQVSAMQWIFVVLPPRETPDRLHPFPPFSARCGAVGFHVRTVEHQFIRDRSGSSHLGEDALPDTTPRPVGISVIDRFCRAILRWHVSPSHTGFQDV